MADWLVNDFTILNLSTVDENTEATREIFNFLDIFSFDECLGVSLELLDGIDNCSLVILLTFFSSSIAFSGGSSAFTSEGLISKQIIDILLELSGCWMTLENNLARLINKENVGNSTRSISL